MDFRTPKTLAKDISADYDLLEAGRGYDHHSVLSMKQPDSLAFNARIMDPKSGNPGEWYNGKIVYKFSTDKGMKK